MELQWVSISHHKPEEDGAYIVVWVWRNYFLRGEAWYYIDEDRWVFPRYKKESMDQPRHRTIIAWMSFPDYTSRWNQKL
jgi:hypothetical protein